jgi:hypothetical protein
MISVAAEGGCRVLLSGDLQDGFSWRGVTVANPFASTRHRLLDALLSGDAGRDQHRDCRCRAAACGPRAKSRSSGRGSAVPSREARMAVMALW